VDGQHLGIRRDKDAVSLIEREVAALIGDRAAAVDAEQHPEGDLIRPVVHLLPPLGVDDHPVHLKILAAGQQLRGNALPVFQHPKGLLRLCAALQVRHIQRLVDVQLPLFAVLAHTVIIVQAVGQVGVFLNLCHQRTRTDGMDCPGLNKEQIILVDPECYRCTWRVSSICPRRPADRPMSSLGQHFSQIKLKNRKKK